MFVCECGRNFTTKRGLVYHKKFCGNYKEFVDNGYKARIGSDGKLVYIHRQVMEQKLGRKLKSNEVVHHIDENKLNNEPNNLELTNSKNHAKHHFPEGKFENLKKGFGSKTFGPKPKIRGSKNGFSKLNENQVLQIKQYLQNGMKCKDICVIFNVSEWTISDIKYNRTWTHIN